MIVSCSSGGLKERAELRTLVSSGQYAKALEYVEKSDFYKKEDNALLRHMELGMIHHYMGNYFQSLKQLEKAKEIHKKLFTKSISSSAKGALANENFDIYYGATYERSLLHFYLSLNHYLLFRKGQFEEYTVQEKDAAPVLVPAKTLNNNERRLELFAARAELLDWDSYMKSIQADKAGKSAFKNDLMAKVYGGMVHEAFARPEDDQIALQLFKDAKTVLFRNYNAYPTYNQLFKKFKGDFDKFPQMGESAVAKDYVSTTSFAKHLNHFLNTKIVLLTKRMRPGDVGNVIKQIEADPKEQKNLLEASKSMNGKNNVSVVIQMGVIPSKVPQSNYFSLESALTPDNPTEAQKGVARIGSQVIMTFAAMQLGLLPPPGNYSPVGVELGVRTAQLAAGGLAIGFELPMMEDQKIETETFIQVFNSKGEMIKELEAPMVNPLVDVARESIAEDSASRYTRLGFRLATKHLTAILASYATYNLIKNKSGDFFAKQAAVIQYVAAAQGIAATEKADTRYWSSLPSDFRIQDLSLPKGNYQLKVAVKKASNPDLIDRLLDLGPIEVKDTEQKAIYSFRI